MELFETANRPLADRMRPESLEEYVGQPQLVNKGQLLFDMISQDQVPSLILWGPPGVGKTSLARVIAESTKSKFVTLSAVHTGIKELRAVMDEAEKEQKAGIRTIVFMDEIHRFNKSQQDAFLPYVESGAITLVGATTENPSFELNNALLSRCQVFVLEPLKKEEVVSLLKRAIDSPKGLGNLRVSIDDESLERIAASSGGDARYALNTLEAAAKLGKQDLDGIHVDAAVIDKALMRRSMAYDKDGEEHYNIISALHKSVRNSDVDAALYWLARMLESGEDPLYPARRMVRMASEDIGMADSYALQIALQAYQAAERLGMPECNVHLAHACVYLALAPKSNAMETAYNAAAADAKATLDAPVPLWLRNGETALMKDLGYGKGYEYSHDYPNHTTDMQCLPDRLKGRKYYNPSDQGNELAVRQRMAQIQALKAQAARNRRKK